MGLNVIYGGIQRGYLCVMFRPKGSPAIRVDRYFSLSDLDAAESHMKALAAHGDCYYTFNVLREPPTTGRGRAEDFIAAGGVFLDVDIKQDEGGIHAANDKLPSNLDEVMDLLERKDLPFPTMTECSGNGYYLRYLFDTPYNFETDQERAEYVTLAKAFERCYQEAFASMGWQLDPMSDLPRITRMSGTLNHKSNMPKEVSLVGYYRDRHLSHAEFKRIAGLTAAGPARTAVVPATVRKAAGPREGDQTEKLADFKPVIEACRWLQSLADRMASLSYPEWFILAGILKHCEGGEDLFHQFSALDARYDPDEAQRLFDQVEGPITCQHIALNGGHDYCKSCPASANRSVGSPVAFGKEPPKLARALGRHVYVVKREMFFDTIDCLELTKTNFSDMNLREFKSPTSTVLANRLLLQAHTTVYQPGIRDLYVKADNGQVMYNLWRPGGLFPEVGPVELVLGHLEYLVPELIEREHLLDIFAHAVQFPGVKIKHCVILIGGQGTGKSWLEQLFKRLFGWKNVFTVDNELLASTFNASMGDKQVAILEEVGQADRAEAYNRTKTWITQETQFVEEKGVPRFEVSTPRLMIGFSNRDLPIKIEGDDRRFMFIETPKQPREREYYDTLFTTGLDQAGAFLKFLLDRDISKFSPDARPPTTAIKQRIAAASRPAAEAELAAMIEAGEEPFDRELFEMSDVSRALQGRLAWKANTSTTELSRALRVLGYNPVDAGQVRVAGRQVRYWAKGTSPWCSATAEEIRRKLLVSPEI